MVEAGGGGVEAVAAGAFERAGHAWRVLRVCVSARVCECVSVSVSLSVCVSVSTSTSASVSVSVRVWESVSVSVSVNTSARGSCRWSIRAGTPRLESVEVRGLRVQGLGLRV